ncbi:cation:proton antiporter [Clostridium ganghwense]|uniref:Cation:proton antiporter n=1 Tax=Clostridium ganghwense TaxID=312089 RepID=A0ABT4CLT7_9CLOT|nr:cation:proton antiporter [Clostridium ganghwense]MCY6370011.1 cation:proton antiporter [Clostridium ganghwense]
MEIKFLMDLAIILLSTKILGLISKKFGMPEVVGALLAGIIIGPVVLGIEHDTEFIEQVAKLGVILLMFTAGTETDLKELKKCGKASLVIAVLGVLVPLIGGFVVAGIYTNGSLLGMNKQQLLQNIFIGVILTATSVSITVQTLQEMGKFKTPSGTAILGAAILDDILGIIILAVITGMSDSSVKISTVLLKIVGFFLAAAILGYVFYKILMILTDKYGVNKTTGIFSLVFCLMMSYIAENYFGVADITGAYFAGVVVACTPAMKYVEEKIHPLSFMLLSPVFFASIGIKTTVDGMNSGLVVFTIVLLVVAILTKLLGCGLGARMCGYSKSESIQIGTGMISRGEVALIVANVGVPVGLMPPKLFAPIIIVVIVTTVVTPVLLKFVYSTNDSTVNVEVA